MIDDDDVRYFIHKKGSFLRKAVGTGLGFIPGIGGIASKGFGMLGSFRGKGGRGGLPVPVGPAGRGPGRAGIVGRIGRGIGGLRARYGEGLRRQGKVILGAGGGVVAYEVGGMLIDAITGEVVGSARKRRQGLSARDIRGASKVAKIVSCFGYKPKMSYRCKRKGRCR